MAFADLAAYKTAVNGTCREQKVGLKQSGSGTSGRLSSWWTTTPENAAAPTTMATCDSSTTGAIGQQNAASSLYLASIFSDLALNNNPTHQYGVVTICDRLAHSGNLSGTSTSAQTVGSVGLPRYATGVGVWAAIEIYSGIGATATTATVSYTNTASVSGRTSTVAIGGSGRQNQYQVLPIPLVSGDTGVLTVDTITLLASTTTAGAFGVTLYKPLLTVPFYQQNDAWEKHALNGGLSGLPVIQSNACLWFLGCAGTATNTAYLSYRMNFADT